MKRLLTPAAYARMCGAWLLVIAAVFFLCMMIGPGDVGTNRFNFGWPGTDIRELRMLRVLAAALVGFALSSAGVTLQALLRNPLADPYVLGISSGSSVGVFLWLLAGGWIYRTLGTSPALRLILGQGKMIPAVIGAVVTCLLVFSLARPRRGSAGGADPLTLLLVGVIVSAITSAVLMLLNSLAPSGVQINFINYMMGSVSNDVSWGVLEFAAVILAIGYIPLLLASPALNIGTLSDVEATSLGVNIARLRTLCFLSASVTTGAAIMLSGPIGFVGLVCPHICRRLVGADHRKLTVAAPLCGAAFLMLADTFVGATGGIFHGELPVGIVTALCGGPFFLFLLKRRSVWGNAA